MLYTAIKVLLTAAVVVAISEVAKRSTLIGGIVASLPLTSLLAFIWLYGETGNTGKIANLSISMPMLLGRGIDFWLSLLIASALTFAAYLLMTLILARFGVTL